MISAATATLSRKIDSLDNWCLWWILNLHWSEFVTSAEVRFRTGQPLLLNMQSQGLSSVLFGHLNRVDSSQDQYRALQAYASHTPVDWRRSPGRPRQLWLRTVETDLRPLNHGLATAQRRAQDRAAWRRLVTTATATTSSWKKRRPGLLMLH